MDLILNGKPYSVAQACSVEELIRLLGLDGKFAVEVNQTIVPRSQYTNLMLQQNDNIEIVQAIGGG